MSTVTPQPPVAAEAELLLEAAARAGLTLRLFGSLGVWSYCSGWHGQLLRVGLYPRDIDLAGLSDERRAVVGIFEDAGYRSDRDVQIATEEERFLFEHPEKRLSVDLHFDRLRFCHTLDVRDRLHLSYPTLTLEDQLLEKFQVFEATLKDLYSVVFLLAEASRRSYRPDREYLGDVLSKRWGFFHLAMCTIAKILSLRTLSDVLSPAEMDTVSSALSEIRAFLEGRPKTLLFRMRSCFGELLSWYTPVSPREPHFR